MQRDVQTSLLCRYINKPREKESTEVQIIQNMGKENTEVQITQNKGKENTEVRITQNKVISICLNNSTTNHVESKVPKYE